MDPNATLSIIRSYGENWSDSDRSTLYALLTRMMVAGQDCDFAARRAKRLCCEVNHKISPERDEAIEAIDDLRHWIQRGGFLPTW